MAHEPDPNRKPAWLRNLRIDKVALVDAGANQHAHISLFKRKNDEPVVKGNTFTQNAETVTTNVTKVKTCPQCGTLMDDMAERCPSCGWVQQTAAPPSAGGTTPARPRGGTYQKSEQDAQTADRREEVVADETKEPTVEERLSALEGQVKERDTTIANQEAELVKLRKDKDTEDKPVDVLKSVQDPVVRSEILKLRKEKEEHETRIAKAESIAKHEKEQRENREYVTKVAPMVSYISADADKLGPMLRKVREADAGAADELERVLTSANALVESNSGVYKTYGSALGQDDSDPDAKLDSLADNLAKAEKVSKSEAYTKVLDTEEGSRLYEQSIAKLERR